MTGLTDPARHTTELRAMSACLNLFRANICLSSMALLEGRIWKNSTSLLNPPLYTHRSRSCLYTTYIHINRYSNAPIETSDREP